MFALFGYVTNAKSFYTLFTVYIKKLYCILLYYRQPVKIELHLKAIFHLI